MLEALEGRILLSRTWFVSPNGNNQNPGTITQPFQTIEQAASLAEPGDTVYLRAGTYRETVVPAHSGTASAPITYAAYNNEIVTIDGADLLSGWTKNANSSTIYSTPQSWDLGAGNNEVFVNGVAMNEASWPNTAIGAVKPATATISSVYSSVIGTGAYYSDTATISVAGLPGGPGVWNGATIHFGAGQGWVIQTGTVLSSGNGTLTFTYQHQTNYETPVAGNKIYLTGKFIGLDHAGEWYRDPTTGRLNLWTPNSASPSTDVVEVKRRQYAFELSGLSYINIRNIHIFAASIDTNASSHNLSISNISASYISQQMLNPIGWLDGAATTGIILLGYNNLLQNSTINWSSGNGVYLGGSTNVVQNCTLENTDYCGADEAAITIVGTGNQILHDVIHDTGRDGILDSSCTNARIEYNTISNIGHQTTDLGGIYDHGTDSKGTIIAFNSLSNIYTGGFGGDGIYLDNGSAHYIVHDNVITNVQIPIKDNPPAYSNSVYNNKINGKVVNSSSGGGSPGAGPVKYSGSSSTLLTLGTTGGYASGGRDINNSGEVVGTTLSAAASPAFLFANGAMTAINALGMNDAKANAINNSGQFVGQGLDGGQRNVAFLDSSGKITNLGTLPGDTSSDAYAINSSGQVVGVSFGPDSIASAFLYTSGSMQRIGTLGGSISQAFGINDAGTVVGAATVAGDRDSHAFSWSAGKMTDLGTLGGSSSYALAINNAGAIAGASLISGNGAFHAFLDVGGKLKDLGTLPGYKNSVATGIDSAGDVVGYAYNGDTSTPHAFLYRNGVMTDLNKLMPQNTGWTIVSAAGINDNNQITGTVTDSTTRTRAYILTIFK